MENFRALLRWLFLGVRLHRAVSLAMTAAVIFSVSGLYAQTFGEITGRVTDPSGALMSGASVTLTNVNTNGIR
jgi:hypothetical protein